LQTTQRNDRQDRMQVGGPGRASVTPWLVRRIATRGTVSFGTTAAGDCFELSCEDL
jgi:hypothetical protein